MDFLFRILADAEDRLFPALRLTSHERALYYHLLRHSRLDGQRAVTRSKQQLADALDLAPTTIRNALRALHRAGCIRIAARLGLRGLLLEVRLPSEISALQSPDHKSPDPPSPDPQSLDSPSSLSPTTHHLSPRSGKGRSTGRFRSPTLRAACFSREQGRCFYCLRLLQPDPTSPAVPNHKSPDHQSPDLISPASWSLDHVVPVSTGGDDSPTNAVACCHECNCAKGEMSAADFLRSLYRRGRLIAEELESRSKFLQSLAATNPWF